MGRYTHRVAITNHRLVSIDNGVIRFRWKDYADHNHVKVMAVSAAEFLRRFLLHVVPPGFMRIRHFGLLANRHRATKLAQCRALLAPPALPSLAPCGLSPLAAEPSLSTTAAAHRCPVCGAGPLRIVERLAPVRGIPP